MRICMVQQHPVDEERIPAAILRWVILHDRFRDAGHQLLSIGPNTRMRFEEREFRGVRQLLVPTPGSGVKSLDMLFFGLLLFPVLLRARREFRPQVWFVDELFVCFGTLLLRLAGPRAPLCYDVMGIHYYQVRKNNRSLLRRLLALLYGAMEHMTLWSCDFVTTVNEAHAQILRRWTSRPVHVIRDAAEFDLNEDMLAEVPLPPKDSERVFLTFVGKVSNRRLDDIFEVLPRVMQKVPQLDFVIVGNGPYYERYQGMARDLKLQKRIHFTDFVPHAHLPAHIRQADFCYSDDWSDIGFPMKVFEYMALGAPVLVEDTPAVREVMRDGENCVLYHGRDDLEHAILLLAEREDLRARIGACAKEEADTLHRWDNRIRAFLDLFTHYGTAS